MIARILFVTSMCAMAFFSGALGLWVIDREPPVTDVQSIVLNNNVTAGQIVRIRVTAYRIRQCKAIIERFIDAADNTRFLFPDVDYANPGPTGRIETIIELTMPQRIQPGLAVLRTNAIWECNPSHKIWPIVVQQPSIGILVTH